VKAHPAYFRQ